MDADATSSAPPRGAAITLGQLLRFGVVGVALNGALFVAYLVLVDRGMAPKPAMTIVYATGLALGFWLHRRLTFASHGAPQREGGPYLAVGLAGYPINLAILAVGVDLWHWPHAWVQGTAAVGIAALTFALNKFWVFSPRERRA